MQSSSFLPGVLLYDLALWGEKKACEKGQKPQQALHLLQELQL